MTAKKKPTNKPATKILIKKMPAEQHGALAFWSACKPVLSTLVATRELNIVRRARINEFCSLSHKTLKTISIAHV